MMSKIDTMLMNEFKDRLLLVYGDDDYVDYIVKQHESVLDKSSKVVNVIEPKVNLDELAYYCLWCDGNQLNKDIYNTSDENYLNEKFVQFRDRFQTWLLNLDGTNRRKLSVAVKEVYKRRK